MVQEQEGWAPLTLKEKAELQEHVRRNNERLAYLEQEHATRQKSGSADAGATPPPKREETPKEYKDRILKEAGIRL